MSDKMDQHGQAITYKGANFGHCEKEPIVLLTICPYADQPFRLFNVFMPISQARKLSRDLRDIFKDLKREKDEQRLETGRSLRVPKPYVPDPDAEPDDRFRPESEEDL